MTTRGGVRYGPLRETDASAPSSSYAGTAIGLGVALGLAVLAIILLSVLLPDVNKPCTKGCGDLTVGCDELCVTDLIIGGGTAGLSLANRLSANHSHDVLVIEAGDNFIDEPLVSDPGNGLFFEDLYLIEPSRFQFQIQTSLQSNGYQMTVNGGRILGGSSSINDCAMFRGTPRFWDELDAATGGTGRFASEHVNQIFKDMEWLKASDVYVPDATRGQTENSVKIEVIPRVLNTSDDAHLIGELFANALGYSWPNTISPNDPAATLGAFPSLDMLYDFNATTNPIVRWTGQKAFLNDTVVDQETLAGVEGRKIKVLVRSTVQKILFHPLDATKAVGVEYLDSKGVQRKAWATSNVVVSAFAQTSSILQRSGVGPAAVLEAANIEPHVINEHVGQNWAHHNYMPIIFLYPALSGVANAADAPLISGWGTAFLEDPVLAPEPDRRGYQPITISFPYVMAYFNFQLASASRGYISVYSDDPSQPAKMEPNLFSDPNDIISWRTHMRTTVSALQDYDPSVFCLSIDNATLYDDNAFEAWLFNNVGFINSLAHNYGTARLSDSSTTGAIDPEFRVFGAKNLRVCDTQAFPTQTDGNPAYVAMALGQLCADAIMQVPIPAKKRKASSTIAKSPKKKERTPKPPKSAHHNKRDGMTLQDYQNIVAFFASVKTRLSMADAQKIISGIKATSTWRELDALYGPYTG